MGNNFINEETVLNFLSGIKKQVRLKEFFKYFNLKDDDSKKELIEILNILILEGKILEHRNGYSIFPKNSNLLVGEIKINGSGNGNVNGVFIDKKDISGTSNGDYVLVERTHNHNAGVVRRILKRNINYLPFTYNNGQFIPYQHKFNYGLICHPSILEGLENGDRVGIKPSATPKNNYFNVIDLIIISKKGDPSMEYKTIAAQQGFDYSYTEEELKEIEAMPTSLSSKDLVGRKDFRDDLVITIDGEKTKDMDDAISCKKIGDKYLVEVHISDVGHYIKKGSALYQRAVRNTTSLYLMNEVFYMLHSKIANGICSLNEGVDRLTLSTTILLDKDGNILDYNFDLGVINSKKKATYEDVNKYYDSNIIVKGYEPILGLLNNAKEVSDILSKKRESRGMLEFASNEPDFEVDHDGKITMIKPRKLGSAEKVIENLMILVDYCFADYMNWLQLPFIRRIHENPDEQKLKDVIKFINSLGYRTKNIKNVHDSRSLKVIMDQLKEREEFPEISDLILKSMRKASYSLSKVPHYALGSKYHAHFTAPIRRAVDLESHYQLRNILLNNNNYSRKELKKNEKELTSFAAHASFREKMANVAEREAEKMEMASLMEKHVGEYFNGRVTNMSLYGMNVRTVDGIKGFVRFEDVLSGNYRYDPESKTLRLDNGTIFKISDSIRMRLIRASKETRTIDFKITETVKPKPKVKKKSA